MFHTQVFIGEPTPLTNYIHSKVFSHKLVNKWASKTNKYDCYAITHKWFITRLQYIFQSNSPILTNYENIRKLCWEAHNYLAVDFYFRSNWRIFHEPNMTFSQSTVRHLAWCVSCMNIIIFFLSTFDEFGKIVDMCRLCLDTWPIFLYLFNLHSSMNESLHPAV